MSKVALVNQVHAKANAIFPEIADHFRLFVGEKTRKKDGSLTKSAEIDLSHLQEPGISVWLDCSYGTGIYIRVKGCSVKNEIANYYETLILVAVCDTDGVLRSIPDNYIRKSDFLVDEVLAKINKIEELSEEIHKTEDSLYPFKTRDKNEL